MSTHYAFPPELVGEVEKLTGMAFEAAVPAMEAALGASFPMFGPLLGFLTPLINKADADLEARVIALEKQLLGPASKPVKLLDEPEAKAE